LGNISNLSPDSHILHARKNVFREPDVCKKNSYLLAEKVAKELNLKLVPGEYKYVYRRKGFYKIKNPFRQPIPCKIKNKDRLKKYHVIIVDDSIVTGNALQSSLDELYNCVDSITFFSIVKIDEKKKTEGNFNNFAVDRAGNKVKFLTEIIRKDQYVFTTHMLRTISELSFNERNELLNTFSKRKKALFYRAEKNYFGNPYKS